LGSWDIQIPDSRVLIFEAGKDSPSSSVPSSRCGCAALRCVAIEEGGSGCYYSLERSEGNKHSSFESFIPYYLSQSVGLISVFIGSPCLKARTQRACLVLSHRILSLPHHTTHRALRSPSPITHRTIDHRSTINDQHQSQSRTKPAHPLQLQLLRWWAPPFYHGINCHPVIRWIISLRLELLAPVLVIRYPPYLASLLPYLTSPHLTSPQPPSTPHRG
jgi:hypothetical protein